PARRDTETVTLRRGRSEPASVGKRLRRLVSVDRRRRVELDDGREELRLQRRRQRRLLGLLQERVHARGERERLGIEDHQLLLDADRPRGPGAEALLDHLPRTPWTGRPAASHA